ncbi:hypothetical protein K9692_004478 [Escherichia coli]|uniref:hypothetical protein n=1 Tax=Buttiauxella gaviniae TaxID=82990 RepID=UPI001DB844A9|nr:hypothetical protein [Escherichia coli]
MPLPIMTRGEWIRLSLEDGSRITCRYYDVIDGVVYYGGFGWTKAKALSLVKIERLTAGESQSLQTAPDMS